MKKLLFTTALLAMVFASCEPKVSSPNSLSGIGINKKAGKVMETICVNVNQVTDLWEFVDANETFASSGDYEEYAARVDEIVLDEDLKLTLLGAAASMANGATWGLFFTCCTTCMFDPPCCDDEDPIIQGVNDQNIESIIIQYEVVQ